MISSITECSDPGLSGTINYGNGLINFIEKSFCAHGICEDVTICQLTNDAGEKNYYLPLGSGNISKNNGGNATRRRKGTTIYNAVRLIQNNDGLFFKLNDGTISRTECNGAACDDWFRPGFTKEVFGKSEQRTRTVCEHVWYSVDPNHRPYTMASSCASVMVTSEADLSGSPIKFSSTILPYYIRGHISQGGAELSSNNQVLTVKSAGNCADTYFVYFQDDYDKLLTDDHPILGEHLLPVRV